jgi:hypothetical protein
MGVWNISTESYVAYTGSKLAGANDKGGVIKAGGTIADSSWTSIGQAEGDVSLFGSQVVSGTNHVPILKGDGAIFCGGGHVIRKVTTDIAGRSNTALRSGGSDSANISNSIKQLGKLSGRKVKTAIRAGYWDSFTAEWSDTPHVTASGAWNIATGADNSSTLKTSDTDQAANPSLATPGELVYMQGSNTPKQDDYKAKTN